MFAKIPLDIPNFFSTQTHPTCIPLISTVENADFQPNKFLHCSYTKSERHILHPM